MSTISWLDYSESERRKMLDVISLFHQQEARDELGLGTVRDAFADMFFPGTSTIQRRAKYFLFVPWIYLDLERRQVSSNKITRKAKEQEYDLIDTLLNSGEKGNGVIGEEARRNLQRLPSNIYWSGLQQWGILKFQGSQAQYHKWFGIRKQGGKSRFDFDEDPESELRGIAYNWHPSIPSIPADFPKNKVTFKLKKSEAQFLKDQISRHCKESLLTFLVQNSRSIIGVVPFAWEHPQYIEFPLSIREKLEHARNFSEIMHGASLLYNLMLAEKTEEVQMDSSNAITGDYRNKIREWLSLISVASKRFAVWDRTRFWNIVFTQNPRIRRETKDFVMNWLGCLDRFGRSFDELSNDKQVRMMIQCREMALKGPDKARLSNPRALETWTGKSGTEQLNYRWPIARTIINDLITGLKEG